MTLEERKAKAVEGLILKSGYTSVMSIPKVRREMVADDVETVCRTVFPELFTDPPSMWLAPWEINDNGPWDKWVDRDYLPALWDEIRDAHLSNTGDTTDPPQK